MGKHSAERQSECSEPQKKPDMEQGTESRSPKSKANALMMGPFVFGAAIMPTCVFADCHAV